ncbi:hypothetical protein TNCV_3179871 [Trichonephila clavipes]|nr:hypothetical protein TNCV_3179871 [Trichonephila clavipes]
MVENRERSLEYPGFVKPVFTIDIKPFEKRKRSLGHLGVVTPLEHLGAFTLVLTCRSGSKRVKRNRSLPMKVSYRGSLVIKLSDRGWHVMSSSPVPLQNRRVRERLR